MRQGGLGRGLSSLIPTDSANRIREGGTGGSNGAELLELQITDIMPNPNQPREHFDEESLGSLALSIKELGVLQPILCRVSPEGAEAKFELIAGERRWRAAKRAGLQTIPAVVRTVADQASVEQALVENLHRDDLNALEEAAAYQQLLEEFSLTHDQLAQRVGKSRVTITNALRLFQLPSSVQKLVRESRISGGHARALLGAPDAPTQERLAQDIISRSLSVRAAEELVRSTVNPIDLTQQSEPTAEPAKLAQATKSSRDPGLLEVESMLGEALSTRVTIEMNAQRGKVSIDVADLQDLERVFRLIMSGAASTSN